MTGTDDDEVTLAGGGRSVVTRRGDVVFRNAGPWSPTVIALLRHLEEQGFAAAPRVVGTGFDPAGREMLSFVPGLSIHPGPWDDEALPMLGGLLRQLHDATASFVPPEPAIWRPWFGRDIGTPSVIGHCDTGPWNIICTNRLPTALIDWEEAGLVDPLVELAQAAWLNAQLYDDDIAEREGLPSPERRARQVRLLLEGYRLPKASYEGFIDLVCRFATLNAANEAIIAGVTPESTDPAPLWAIAWRTRSAAWIVRHRALLERVLMSHG